MAVNKKADGMGAGLRSLPEFSEGAREFVKSIGECPECAIKLALELVDSNDEDERKILKEVLVSLGKAILKQREREEDYKTGMRILSRFPLINAWLRGEIGLRRWLSEG